MIFFIHFSPFFGDDIHFEVPKDFRSLCFYIRDADPFYRDTVIGKVSGYSDCFTGIWYSQSLFQIVFSFDHLKLIFTCKYLCIWWINPLHAFCIEI